MVAETFIGRFFVRAIFYVVENSPEQASNRHNQVCRSIWGADYYMKSFYC